MQRKDITGKRFGRLVAVRLARTEKRVTVTHAFYWLYKCDCGKAVIRPLQLDRRHGNVMSCGCARKTRKTHGASVRGARTAEYGIWCGMRARCKYPQFKDYVGRGITVCSRWNDFSNFLADMGKRPSPLHSLERKDNNKGYNKRNCKWGTQREQNRNKRNNHRITYKGETRTLVDWAEITGLPYDALKMRIYAGWPSSLALTLPINAPRLRTERGDRFAPGRGKQP